MTDLHPDIAATLTNADWIVINSSAGKDSQCMLDVIVQQADALGIPRSRLVVAHADLDVAEWPGTRELAAEHAAHYGLRFEVVRRRTADGRPQSLLQHVRQRGKWPSSTARYCTSDHKRGPVRTLLTRLAAETRAAGKATPAVIVNCMGLRAEESPARAKRRSWEKDARASNGRRVVWTWLPILRLSERQVWDRIAQAGTRWHPAYRRVGRLSCQFCIFSPRDALAIAGQENPMLLAEYVAVEQAIGHKFRMNLSLVDVQRDVEAGRVPERCGGSWCM
jgi:3'-phosphoadenosine 5'-phosphosulfate sulfotransferase (PAPS reductase)/FAD synthetase